MMISRILLVVQEGLSVLKQLGLRAHLLFALRNLLKLVACLLILLLIGRGLSRTRISAFVGIRFFLLLRLVVLRCCTITY